MIMDLWDYGLLTYDRYVGSSGGSEGEKSYTWKVYSFLGELRACLRICSKM